MFILPGDTKGQASDPYFIESKEIVSAYAPDHITRDILQDKKGHFWLATWLGIIEYDGKAFTNHTLKDDLVHFHVICCYEDSKGNLWFGTARGGLYRYDGRSFRLFTTKDGLADNNIGCISEDKDGNIWIGTESGVSSFNGTAFRNFTKQNGFTNSFVNCIIQDKNGSLLFGTTAGLYIFDGQSFTRKKGLPFDRITSLLEDRKGRLWVSSFDGLVRYDGKTYTPMLSKLLTYYLIEDQKGNIWASHSEPNTRYADLPKQVLYKYDGNSFSKVLEKDDQNDFQVFGKMEDRAGNIWFGTMHGPCRYDGKSFTYFTKRTVR